MRLKHCPVYCKSVGEMMDFFGFMWYSYSVLRYPGMDRYNEKKV